MLQRYEPKTIIAILGAASEKCGDLTHAIGKTLRWGLHNYNPDLPKDDRITNLEFLQNRIQSLRRSLDRLEQLLISRDK